MDIDKMKEVWTKLRWKDLTPQFVVETLVEAVQARVKPLEAKIAELEQMLDARSYKGVYSRDYDYCKHNMVTHQGCLWIAVENPTGGPPGNGWTLAVKRGRDQREQAKDNFVGEHSYRRESR